MERYRKILEQQADKHASSLRTTYGLLCSQMQYADDPVLYLAKPAWTNRFDQERESTIGIFFSIWVTSELVERGQFAYNIHAKQLRKLSGYKLTARKFADEFRQAVKASVANWPGVRMDFGPLTLLEGRVDCTLDDFARKIEQRITGFVTVHHEVDNLLDASRIS